MRNENGQIRRFLNVHVNEEDIRFLGGASYAFQDGARYCLVPSIAGGSNCRATPNKQSLESSHSTVLAGFASLCRQTHFALSDYSQFQNSNMCAALSKCLITKRI